MAETEQFGIDINSELDFNYSMSILASILFDDDNSSVSSFQDQCNHFSNVESFDNWLTDLVGTYCLPYGLL